jgi:hypothetical protein
MEKEKIFLGAIIFVLFVIADAIIINDISVMSLVFFILCLSGIGCCLTKLDKLDAMEDKRKEKK